MDTLYFGGGTPSVLPIEAFKEIVSCLKGIGVQAPFDEFTVEVNPEDIVEKGEEFIRGLIDLGVDRISMGIQSFDDSMLKWMNRRHSSSGAVEAVNIIRNAGIKNLSLDLIFGISHLSDKTWEETIDKTIALSPEHISAYQLSIEDGSALAKLVQRGKYEEADDTLCKRQFDVLCSKLSEAGYLHYEVSNFCKPDKHARHNSAYWKRLPYVGLGPGAHSFQGDTRSWNSQSLERGDVETETLSSFDKVVETIMLALRTADGIDFEYLKTNCNKEALDNQLSEGNLVIQENGKARIPEDKFFISDLIIRELI